jgi:hypothetical protein
MREAIGEPGQTNPQSHERRGSYLARCGLVTVATNPDGSWDRSSATLRGCNRPTSCARSERAAHPDLPHRCDTPPTQDSRDQQTRDDVAPWHLACLKRTP